MFVTDTFPGTTTPAHSFVSGLLDEILVAGGLTFIEQVDASATVFTRVYAFPDGRIVGFNAGYYNGANSDYITTMIAEGYNVGAASPVVRRALLGSENSAVSVLADGSIAGGDQTVATWLGNNRNPRISGSGSPVWASVTADRIIIGWRDPGGVDAALYIGTLASVPAAAAVSPAGGHFLLYPTIGGYVGASTREPGITAAQSASHLTYAGIQADGAIGSVVDTYSGRFPAARARVISRRTGTGRRGLLRDTFVSAATGILNGDTSTIDGRQHVCIKNGAASAFFVDTTV